MKILKNYEDIIWDDLNKTVNLVVVNQANNLDLSFNTFKDCAYSSI
jgi:hypothetical protein